MSVTRTREPVLEDAIHATDGTVHVRWWIGKSLVIQQRFPAGLATLYLDEESAGHLADILVEMREERAKEIGA